MGRSIIAYGVTLIVFLGVDAVYLTTVGGRQFKETLGDVMAPSLGVVPAILFYLIYPVGLVIFAATPAFGTARWSTALIYGALLGFFAYGTYDLTNWATIRNWTPALVVMDILWGTFVSAVAATAGFLAARAFQGGG